MSSSVVASGPAKPVKPTVPIWSKIHKGDEIAHLVTFLFAASVLLVTVMLVAQLWTNSAPSRAHLGWGFFWGSDWDAVTDKFGAAPFVYGTILTSVLALMISVPLGVGAAIFLAELAPPRLANACTFLVELLAAVPSVIYCANTASRFCARRWASCRGSADRRWVSVTWRRV